jgi:hypothetical protein
MADTSGKENKALPSKYHKVDGKHLDSRAKKRKSLKKVIALKLNFSESQQLIGILFLPRHSQPINSLHSNANSSSSRIMNSRNYVKLMVTIILSSLAQMT